MRSPEEVRLVQQLAADGLNACEIARRTGIPRPTVSDWVKGRLPRAVVDHIDESSCPACGHPLHDPSKLPAADYSYLLGMYLGDGCLSRSRKGVYRLRIACDMHHPAIICEVSATMISVMPTSRVGTMWRLGGGWGAEVYSDSKAWACLFPQHGPGRKHKRKIALAPWQERIVDAQPEQFVRGLIHSDGCRVRNRVNRKDYPRYFFSQVSDDIRRLFCRSLRQLGIDYTWNDARNVSIARRPSVARLDEFVGPKR
jgi:hypothetical protein